jgi:hypothetical protein
MFVVNRNLLMPSWRWLAVNPDYTHRPSPATSLRPNECSYVQWDMMNETWWAKERKLGVAGIAGVATGWVMLLYIHTFFIRLWLLREAAFVGRPSNQSRLSTRDSMGGSKGQVVVGDWVSSGHFAPVGRAGNFHRLLRRRTN